jgi:hypothetical protein
MIAKALMAHTAMEELLREKMVEDFLRAHGKIVWQQSREFI